MLKGIPVFFDVNAARARLDLPSLGDTWIDAFSRILLEKARYDNLESIGANISILCFNYDRCIEHFIYYALKNNYPMLSNNEAAELVKNIKIYHPYGSVGTLPWINRNYSMEFGKEPNPEELLQLVKEIKTFSEGTDPDSSEILKIRKYMGMADKLVFLGFAFDKLNLELIYPDHDDDKKMLIQMRSSTGVVVNCFATTYDLSSSDEQIIKDQIQRFYGFETLVNITNSKCGLLFKEFSKSLAF